VADCSRPLAKQPKTPPPAHTELGGHNSGGEWKLARARTSWRKRLLLKPEMPMPNGFTAVHPGGEGPISGDTLELNKAAQSVPCLTTSTIKKRQ